MAFHFPLMPRIFMAVRSLFPRIGELPYLLTMGSYDFYWFRLRRL
jgi:hypothetical protein